MAPCRLILRLKVLQILSTFSKKRLASSGHLASNFIIAFKAKQRILDYFSQCSSASFLDALLLLAALAKKQKKIKVASQTTTKAAMVSCQSAFPTEASKSIIVFPI